MSFNGENRDLITLKCAQCGKKTDFLFGAGFMNLFSEEVAQKMSSGYFGEDWKTLYEKDQDPCDYGFFAKRALCVCPSCGEYWTEVVLHSWSMRKSKSPETLIKCGKCGNNVDIITCMFEFKRNLRCKERRGEMKVDGGVGINAPQRRTSQAER